MGEVGSNLRARIERVCIRSHPEVYRVPRTTALATSKEGQQGAMQASKKKDECVGFLSL